MRYNSQETKNLIFPLTKLMSVRGVSYVQTFFVEFEFCDYEISINLENGEPSGYSNRTTTFLDVINRKELYVQKCNEIHIIFENEHKFNEKGKICIESDRF